MTGLGGCLVRSGGSDAARGPADADAQMRRCGVLPLINNLAGTPSRDEGGEP